MKRIKYNVRSCMGQQWHSFLSLMMIANDILESVIEACRERSDGPGHPRQGGIERVKLQKL